MKKKLVLLLVLCLMVTVTGFAATEEWTFNRPVEIVCPFGSGGGVDTALRTIQPALEKELGVAVVINNQPGSSGVVGYEFFMNQPADGYTFGMVTASHVVNEVNGLMSVGVLEATEGVAILNSEDYVLLAPKDAPYDDLLQLGEYAKDKAGEVSVACISMGGSDEFALRLLFDALDIELTMVPYSSGSEQISAILGGFVNLILSSPSESKAFINSGDMKALGIFNQVGNSVLPDVPSAKDLGLDIDFQVLRAMVAKKGTPEGAIQAMQKAIAAAVETEIWTNYMANAGMDSSTYANGEQMMQKYAALLETVAEGKALADAAGN